MAKKEEASKIVLQCILNGFRSLVDQSIRVTFDVNENQLESILELNSLKNEELTIVIMKTQDLKS